MNCKDHHSKSLSSEAIERLLGSRQQFLNFLARRVESKADAEDILQAAFVRGIERGGSLRDEETVIAWFYRLLRNAVVDHYRHQGHARKVMEEWGEDLETMADPNDSLKDGICQCMAGLMPELKSEYKQALEIVDLGEGSLSELAEQAAITPTNAAVRVHRARQALKKQVELACGACAEHSCLECDCLSSSVAG